MTVHVQDAQCGGCVQSVVQCNCLSYLAPNVMPTYMRNVHVCQRRRDMRSVYNAAAVRYVEKCTKVAYLVLICVRTVSARIGGELNKQPATVFFHTAISVEIQAGKYKLFIYMCRTFASFVRHLVMRYTAQNR